MGRDTGERPKNKPQMEMVQQGAREGRASSMVPAALPESHHFISLSSESQESSRFCRQRRDTRRMLRTLSPGLQHRESR